jgi:hypothetical protein
MSEAAPAGNGPVLVCGLGAFGQAVVCRLLPFAIPLRLIDQREPDWRTPELRQSLHQVLTLGDMRRPHVLRSAGADQARAVLLLSSDGGANIEAALQVRLLNETAEIVIRASDDLESLGSLLQQRLPRLTVVNPLQLSVGALVQALRPGPQLACFAANGETFNVRDCPLQDQRFQKIVRMDGGGKSLVVMPFGVLSTADATSTGLDGSLPGALSTRGTAHHGAGAEAAGVAAHPQHPCSRASLQGCC